MRVIIAESFAPRGQAVLSARGIDVVSCVGSSRAQLIEALREADGLIVRSETRVDRELLASAPRMRVVGRAGVGVDAIDVPAATEAGIVVVNTPAANTIAAAEQTMALMLALLRHVAPANASLLAGRWERAPFVGSELFAKTLGIVGLGRIGGAVATRARAFEARVIAHDPFVPRTRAQTLGVDLCSLEELLESSDAVSLHVPLNTQTQGMIDASALARMKSGAVLINCARGGLVDEEALLAALDAGSVRAAAIDVVSQSRLPPNPQARALRGTPGSLRLRI